MLVNKPTAALLFAALLILQNASASQAYLSGTQDPAPPRTWQDWQLVGTRGGVDFLASISSDDGRNDFELKIKIDNQNTYAIQMRLTVVVESAEGEKKSRDNVGIGRLNGKRAADACSTTPGLCFGVLFPSAVFQKEPTRIAKLILPNVEVANIDAPPANASPGAYLERFRNFPTTRRRDLSTMFGSGSSPAFIKADRQMRQSLARWTRPDCDDAVDQIIKTYKRSISVADQNCIKEWRHYQKCYESYAYDSNPVPRPSCQRPLCKVRG